MLEIDENSDFRKINRNHRLHVSLVFVYILITPLSMVEVPGIGSAMKVLSILLLLVGLLLLISENVTIKLNHRLVLSWIAYVSYTALSLFWSTNFSASLQIVVGLLQVLAISLVLSKFNLYEKDVRKLESAWLLVSVVCLVLFFGGAGQQIEYGGRSSIVLGTGGADPNEFCAYFYIPLSIIMVRLFRSKSGIRNLFYAFLMISIFYCIFLTGSRGGMLAAMAAVIISWLFSTAFSLKKIVFLCILIAMAYVIFLFLFVPNLPQPVMERFRLEAIVEDKGSDRLVIWETALSNITSGTTRLIYGYGPFGITFMSRYTMHNQFIQALMDGGIIGLLLYLNFCIELTRRAYRSGPVLFGGIAGAFTALMTLTAYAFFKPIWLIFLMCLLTDKREEPQGSSKWG